MGVKTVTTRFNIQFNRENAIHLQAVDILNRQDTRGKARYIAEAILHYENCDDVQGKAKSVRIDEKMIEVVVKRMLHEIDIRSESKLALSKCPTEQVSHQIVNIVDEININDAMEALGEDGFNAVTVALNMFKNK